MPTEKQMAANRQNAEKSTGPRTKSGKMRSRLNASRHNFATSQWMHLLNPALSFEQNYKTLMEQGFTIDREKAMLLARVEQYLATGEHDRANIALKRAAALDRYDRQVRAAVRRQIKNEASRKGKSIPHRTISIE
jgi:hypothetical protein